VSHYGYGVTSYVVVYFMREDGVEVYVELVAGKLTFSVPDAKTESFNHCHFIPYLETWWTRHESHY